MCETAPVAAASITISSWEIGGNNPNEELTPLQLPEFVFHPMAAHRDLAAAGRDFLGSTAWVGWNSAATGAGSRNEVGRQLLVCIQLSLQH